MEKQWTRGKMPSRNVKVRYVSIFLFSSDVKEWDKGKRLQFLWCKIMGQGKMTSILAVFKKRTRKKFEKTHIGWSYWLYKYVNCHTLLSLTAPVPSLAITILLRLRQQLCISWAVLLFLRCCWSVAHSFYFIIQTVCLAYY